MLTRHLTLGFPADNSVLSDAQLDKRAAPPVTPEVITLGRFSAAQEGDLFFPKGLLTRVALPFSATKGRI